MFSGIIPAALRRPSVVPGIIFKFAMCKACALITVLSFNPAKILIYPQKINIIFYTQYLLIFKCYLILYPIFSYHEMKLVLYDRVSGIKCYNTDSFTSVHHPPVLSPICLRNLAVFRGNSWPYTQVSLLAVLRGSSEMMEIETGLITCKKKQAAYLLYYLCS